MRLINVLLKIQLSLYVCHYIVGIYLKRVDVLTTYNILNNMPTNISGSRALKCEVRKILTDE